MSDEDRKKLEGETVNIRHWPFVLTDEQVEALVCGIDPTMPGPEEVEQGCRST